MDHNDRNPYELDELIQLIEDIRNGKADSINLSKAFYTLVLEIQELKKNAPFKGLTHSKAPLKGQKKLKGL